MKKELRDVLVALSLILLIVVIFFIVNSQIKEVEVVEEIDYEGKVLEGEAIVGQAKQARDQEDIRRYRSIPSKEERESRKRESTEVQEREEYLKEEEKEEESKERPDEGVRRAGEVPPSKEEREARKMESEQRTSEDIRWIKKQEEKLDNCKEAILEGCYDTENDIGNHYEFGTTYYRDQTDLQFDDYSAAMEDPDVLVLDQDGNLYEGQDFEKLYICKVEPDICKDSKTLFEVTCKYIEVLGYKIPIKFGEDGSPAPFYCELGCENGACLKPLIPSGCTDPEADNYLDEVNSKCKEYLDEGIGCTDNGLCVYYGCTDNEADNYDDKANWYDGSCIYLGCIYDSAVNYYDKANVDDGSCIFGTCMDEEADNTFYNIPEGLICGPDGVICVNDGSCLYYGCTNPQAENYLDEENSKCVLAGDKCVDDGSCIVFAPDLSVNQIYDPVKSEGCMNSFHFEICNIGNLVVEDEFNLKVTANEIYRVYRFKFNKLPIEVDQCIDISVPALFHIGSFGLGLDQTADVKVDLDTDYEIIELDENNNLLMGQSYTGDDYYYAEGEVCGAFCFETDVGVDYDNYGELTYKYVGEISEVNDQCAGWDDNNLILKEQNCILPIIKKLNNKTSNPLGSGNKNCLEDVKKCESGQCVPLDVYCENAYGELVPCLQCIDNEVPYVLGDGGEILGWVGEVIDPFVKGTIDPWITINNEEKTIEDECNGGIINHPTDPNKWGSEELKDSYCKNQMGFNVVGNTRLSCYRLDDGNDNTEFYCYDGACTPCTEDDYAAGFCIQQTCDGPKEDELNPLIKGEVSGVKLLGEGYSDSDYCYNDGDYVEEVYCDDAGKFKKYKSTNCDQILGENGVGASCVDGECRFLDESLMDCVEWGDIDIDPDNFGGIEYVTGYGKVDWDEDHCDNDDTLIETYCVGNENKIIEFSCADEGKVCSNGACKTGNPELMTCWDSDNGMDLLTSGSVNFIDMYGDGYSEEDSCVDNNEKELIWWDVGTQVKEQYCEDKVIIIEGEDDIVVSEHKEGIFPCPDGLSCYKDKCQEIDLDQADCIDHPELENTKIIIQPNGEESIKTAYCNGDGFLMMPSCIKAGDSYYIDHNSEPCLDDYECKFGVPLDGQYSAFCHEPNYDLFTCDVHEWGVSGINQWGENYELKNECVNEEGYLVFESNQIKKLFCDEDNMPKEPEEPEECPDNTFCAKGECVPFSENKVCNPTEFGVEGIDNYGVSYEEGKKCKSVGSVVEQPFCDENDDFYWETIEVCDLTKKCHPTDLTCKPYDKPNCIGPPEPDLYVKSGITGTDGFGEPFNFIDDGIELGSQDICFTELNIPQELIDEWWGGVIPNKEGVKFWCEDSESPEGDNFKCPEWEICNDGICVLE